MRNRTATPIVLAAALVVAPVVRTGLAAQVPAQVAAKPTRNGPAPATAPATAPAIALDSAFRDSTEVTAVARRNAAAVRHCYQEQGLKADPSLRALLRVELVVLPTGIVQAATATATEVTGDGMPAVLACVSTAARTWRFSEDAPRTARAVVEFDLLPPSP